MIKKLYLTDKIPIINKNRKLRIINYKVSFVSLLEYVIRKEKNNLIMEGNR